MIKLSRKQNIQLLRIILTVAAFIVLFVVYSLHKTDAAWWVWLITFSAVYLFIAYDILFKAAKNIAHGKIFDENFLMIVATVGAFAMQEYPEAVAVMVLYQVGEFFQDYATDKSKRSITELMNIKPEFACVLDGDAEHVTAPENVDVGSIIIVKSGEKIPIDGVITGGEGYLDCSALTGESNPIAVKAGDNALSGAINSGGVITIRTTKKYRDSNVTKILELVQNASSKKAETENFITRFAAIYTPIVCALALVIAVLPSLIIGYNDFEVWKIWLNRALTFLVVSCPCALVISVPMTFFGGLGACSKRGILVKGGSYLERFASVKTMVFDKTGTITYGKFKVVNVIGDREKVLSYAARAEQFSTHPIAQSIVSAADEQKIKYHTTAENAREVAGKGVICGDIYCGNYSLLEDNGIRFDRVESGCKTVVYVAKAGQYLGAIEIADEIKPSAKETVEELKKLGVNTVMLTGDKKEVAKTVASAVGVDEYKAELLPTDKVNEVEKLIQNEEEIAKKNNKKSRGAVAFVGDGINDAPVLSRADVGVAMGGLGSDAAIEAADIVLMKDNLSDLATVRCVAKKTTKIVTENIIFALAVKLIVLILAGFGVVSMWLAVFADVGVTILATINAMRATYLKDGEMALSVLQNTGDKISDEINSLDEHF